MRRIGQVDENCKKSLATSYIKTIESASKKIETQALDPEDKRRALEAMSLMIMDLSVLGRSDFSLSLESAREDLFCHKKSDNDYLKLINDVIEGVECEPQKVGESRVIDNDSSESDTGVRQKYRIERSGDKKYRVDLNVKFKNEKGVSINMNKEANQCLSEMNKYMKGPDGEKLSIEINGSKAKNLPQNSVEIIGDPFHRSSSNKWAEDITCETIAHEVLHLLGLVDEYCELHSGYTIDPGTGEKVFHKNKPKGVHYSDFFRSYNCRVYGPTHSLMSNQRRAKEMAENGRHNGISCTCLESNDKACGSLLQNISHETTSCPSGVQREADPITIDDAKRLGLVQVSSSSYWKMNQAKIYSPKIEYPSILLPSHFYVILYPGCEKINGDYFHCAETAYTTSYDEDCPPRKEECSKRGGSEWLLKKRVTQ